MNNTFQKTGPLKKLVIYDMQHFEMMNVLINLFQSDDTQILILTNKIIYSKFNSLKNYEKSYKNIIFEITDNYESFQDYLNNSKNKLNEFKPELFILNTLADHYSSVWRFLKSVSCPYLVTVHNINTWLKPPFTLNKKALRNYYFRYKILKKSAALIVQEESFIGYVRDNKLYKKPILTIPHTFRPDETKNKSIPENDKLTITIPGGIDGIRRDNFFSLDVIETMWKKNISVRFIFIGKIMGPVGQQIKDRITQLEKSGCDVQHVYDENSNVEFEQLMAQCDLVFVPMNVKTKFEGIDEVYGKTKVTGILYDLMRFCKPGIVPLELTVPEQMKDCILSYKSKDELLQILENLSGNKNSVKQLQSNSEICSGYYTINKIRDRVIPEIIKIKTHEK